MTSASASPMIDARENGRRVAKMKRKKTMNSSKIKLPPEQRCRQCSKPLGEIEGTTLQEGWRICDTCYLKGNSGLVLGRM